MPRRVRRYRLDAPAALFVGTTFIVGLGAFFSQNNLLYVAFGLAIGSLLVSGVLSGFSMISVASERRAPRAVVVGEPATITYAISNGANRLPALAVGVSETIVREVEGWQQSLTVPVAFAPIVRRDRPTICEGAFVAERRGLWRFSGIEVSTRFPYGLIRKSVSIEDPGMILVLPRPIEPPSGVLDQALQRAAMRLGVTRTTGAGADPEFYALREYMPGDPMRQISWRATARRDELIVRIDAGSSHKTIRVALFLDESPDADDANERAIGLAAGVIRLASRRGCRVGLEAPGFQHERAPIGCGARIDPLMEDLARLDCRGVDMGAQRSWRPHHDDALIVVTSSPKTLGTHLVDAVVVDASYARPAQAASEGEAS